MNELYKEIECLPDELDDDYEYYRRELMEGLLAHLTQPR